MDLQCNSIIKWLSLLAQLSRILFLLLPYLYTRYRLLFFPMAPPHAVDNQNFWNNEFEAQYKFNLPTQHTSAGDMFVWQQVCLFVVSTQLFLCLDL